MSYVSGRVSGAWLGLTMTGDFVEHWKEKHSEELVNPINTSSVEEV